MRYETHSHVYRGLNNRHAVKAKLCLCYLQIHIHRESWTIPSFHTRGALKDPHKLRGTAPQVPPETSRFRYQWPQRTAFKPSPGSQGLVATWGVEVLSKPQNDAEATLTLADLPLAHWSGAFPNMRLPLPGENTALSIFLLQKALALFFLNARLFQFNQAHINEVYEVAAAFISPPNISFIVICLWPCTLLLFWCPNLIRAEHTHKRKRPWQGTKKLTDTSWTSLEVCSLHL